MSMLPQTATLHISNLPYDTTEEDLTIFLKDYQISFLTLIKKSTKKFARVEFPTPGMAEKAKNELNGLNFLPRSSKSGLTKVVSLSNFEEKDQFQLKNDVSKNVLVKNISPDFTGREFYLMMKTYGDIKYMKFKIDFLCKSKGYGEVYYYTEEAATKAINDLNGKRVLDKDLIVCHLIPGKTAANYKNNLYIKNFPKTFTEDELKQYFSKYGELKSVLIAKDEKGISKGFGFICYDNPKQANEAYLKENQLKTQFEGCDEALYINYAMKKEDRVEMFLQKNTKLEETTLYAKIRDDLIYIKDKEDLEKEIRSAMKTIMNQDVIIKEMKIKPDNKSALITLLNSKQVEQFMQAYINYSSFYLPKIFFNYYQSKDTKVSSYLNQMTDLVNPLNMFSHFSNLSVIDPNDKPVLTVEQANFKQDNYSKRFKVNSGYYKNAYSSKGKRNKYQNNYKYSKKKKFAKAELVEIDDDLYKKSKKEVPLYNEEDKEEICNEIYEYVAAKHPDIAGKVTGMIIDLGYEEIKRLSSRKDQLEQIMEEAVTILNKKA